MAKVMKTPLINDDDFVVKKVVNLNFFSLTGKEAHTKGTSNKTYAIELQTAKVGRKAQIYSMWGPTGGTQTRDWRYYDTQADADKDFAKIIKSKKKKGYEEIDVAQRAYGSDAAKSITKAIVFKNIDKTLSNVSISILHPKVGYLMGELFGKTNSWVAKTLKCPLGQLTNNQIDKGRNYLSEAKSIINKNKLSKKEKKTNRRINK